MTTPELFREVLEALASRGAAGEMTVRGISMRPLLHDGDRLQLVPAARARPPIGAIVVWISASGPVTHRLVARWRHGRGTRVLTKGDAALRLDAPQPSEALVAYALAVRSGSTLTRLQTGWRPAAARLIAALSLATGLALELWDRCRRRHGWRGSRADA